METIQYLTVFKGAHHVSKTQPNPTLIVFISAVYVTFLIQIESSTLQFLVFNEWNCSWKTKRLLKDYWKILLFSDVTRFVDSLIIQESTGHGKPVLSHILCCTDRLPYFCSFLFKKQTQFGITFFKTFSQHVNVFCQILFRDLPIYKIFPPSKCSFTFNFHLFSKYHKLLLFHPVTLQNLNWFKLLRF